MMKRYMYILVAALCALAAVVNAQSNAVWIGRDGGDSDFSNTNSWFAWPATNTPYEVQSIDVTFFRGDGVPDYPWATNVVLSEDYTVGALRFQKGGDQNNPGASYRFSSEGANTYTLMIDGVASGKENAIIHATSESDEDQVFECDVTLKTAGDANAEHISSGKNAAGGDLTFAGKLTTDAGGTGLGVKTYVGDIIFAGDIDTNGKLWKFQKLVSGEFRFAGSGVWSGIGTVQVWSDVKILLDRDTTDSTGFGPQFLQAYGGSVIELGNDEQMRDWIEYHYGSGTAKPATLDLNGHTETLKGLKFGGTTGGGCLDMGEGGVLRLTTQNSAATWGTLTITNWNAGSDHIYVDGGSFSATQLAGIKFDEYADDGAKVVDGELLPVGDWMMGGFTNWIAEYSLTAGDDAADSDPDGDGVVNLDEYGFGGDPTNSAVTGTLPVFEINGSTLDIIYVERTSAYRGISYSVEQTPDLVSTAWTANGISLVGESAEVDGFKTVTNQVSTDAAVKFLNVVIEQD
ncbi:hypothetical protein [Tichowtungia aerotolerans]|uniref:Uncharacterized protein n=1 Tax=Tichowtungia aerotolerans TaxID=2697043 RepID=A0A6P1M716_9BACT|nr:hypothetical protein [Tichowtungia aerotolerans]QHI70380.1 hypothetical protein GT409_13325 [Tichowtungia aerotolerans]